MNELDALADISRIVNEIRRPVEERLQAVVDRMPAGWRHPEITEARITLDGATYATSGFRQTEWVESAEIEAGEQVGRIDVVLTRPVTEGGAGPFLDEERALLDHIARVVGEALKQGRRTRMLVRAVSAIEEAVLLTRNRRIVDVNPAAERMFGYSRAELIGSSTEPLHVDEEHFERFGRRAQSELTQTGVFHGDVPLRRRDGTVFPAEQTITLLNPDAGLDSGVVNVVRDVSGRKQAERELRESEKRFRLIAERIDVVFWIMSGGADGQIEYVNPAYRNVWGRDPEELLRDRSVWIESILPSDRARVIESLPDQAEGTYEEEYRIVRPDGEIRWIYDRAYPVEDESGDVTWIIGVAEDVTDRKLAEERLAVVGEQMADALHVLGTDGRILYATPSAEGVMGYPPDEQVGRSGFDLIHPDDRDRLKEMLREIVAHPGAVARASFRVVARDGEIRHVESVGRNRIDHPAIGGVVVTTRDITMRRELEEQLRQSQKMEAVGRLAGGIAHDFNNLLTVIRSQTDLILIDAVLTPELEADMRTIQASADRAAQLTSQLLAFSREQVLQPRVVDLSTVVEGMARLLERVIGEDVSFNADLPAGLPPIRVDPGQLEQVVMNLVVNARDAMPEGGTLTLRTRLDVVASDEPGGEHADDDREPGEYVVLDVRDTGTGMDEAIRTRIFEPFFTTKPKGKGTGLGLAMVYGIVTQSGGIVDVESEPGVGTTFSLCFRTVDEAPESTPAQHAGDGTVVVSGRVLVVEDDDAVRRVTRRILERAGIEVSAFETAESGLEHLAEKGDFDIVLTDLVLPGMSGRRLVDRLMSERPDLRLIVMSGYAEDSPGDPGDLPESVRFLQKPFTPEELVECVFKVLSEN